MPDMQILHAFIIPSSFLLSLFSAYLLRKFSFKLNLLAPKGIPLIGGPAVILSFACSLLIINLFYRGLSKGTTYIIFSSAMMFIFGLIDDWRELSVKSKFLVQIISATILIYFGIRTHIVYIGDAINIAITVIWLLGMTNAFNHLDVLDGVAGGVGIIVCSAFFIISLLKGDADTALLSLALAGSLCGFLFFNFPPAKIYLGNSGSHFLGFILAAVALSISYAPMERKIALFSPILILGFPIFDTVFLILMRLRQSRPIFSKSNDHLALRFLTLHSDKKKALFFMLLLAAFFSGCGVIISMASNFISIAVIIITFIVSLPVITSMSKVNADE